MRKYLLLFVVTVFLSSLISCGEKTKEEKFLSDLEEFVEKVEKVETKEDLNALEDFSKQCEKKFADLYGVNDPTKLDGSGLNLTDEQKEKYYKIIERLVNAAQKTREIYHSKDKSDDITKDVEESDESDTDNSDMESNSNDSDFDEMLESYEEYVDEYISYLKKAKNSDMSALSEYPELMEKAQDLSKKIEKCKDEMTPSQWARYNKITMKMLEAAQNMHE